MTPNLHQVSAELWRGGQPIPASWPKLHRLGIRRVLKLNSPFYGSDDMAEGFGMRVTRIHLSDDEAQSALRDPTMLGRIDDVIDEAVDHQNDGALLVHCTEGVDRTGIAIARYRVRRCVWTKSAAFDEWVKFGSHGYIGLVYAWNMWEVAA